MSSRPSARIPFLACLLAAMLISLSSCGGPAGPAPGTPAWFWQAAQTTWSTGDLQKTSDNLETLAKPGSEFADRAQPWRLMITAGMAAGYMKIADAYEAGAKVNQGAAAEFRRVMADYRSQANRQAVQFFQTFAQLQQANAAGEVPIAFSFPQGSAQEVASLNKIAEGHVLSEREAAAAEQQSLQREVLLTVCNAVGAKQDTAKAQKIFAGENPVIPRETFLAAVAEELHRLGDIYSPRKLDKPDRVKLFDEKALEVLKSLPESEETKKLAKEIEKELKAANKRLK